MLNKFKSFKSVIVFSIASVLLCILTFLAFINPKLLFFLNINLQVLLILDTVLLIIFLLIIFKKSFNLYYLSKKKKNRIKNLFKVYFFIYLIYIYSFIFYSCVFTVHF